MQQAWKDAQLGTIGLKVNADTYRAAQIFDLWVNGYYFHDDEYKYEAIQMLPPIMAVLSRTMLINLVANAVDVVLATGWIIEQSGL